MASRTPRCSDLPTRGQGYLVFLVCPFRWVLNVREDKTRKGKCGPDVHFMTRLLSAVSIERFLDYVREISVVQYPFARVMAGLVFMLLQLEQYVLNEHLTAFRQHPDERRLKHSTKVGVSNW